MKGGFGGRFAPASFGTAVWVIASTRLISAIMGGGLRVQVGASRTAFYAEIGGWCRSTRRYRTRRFVVTLGQLQKPYHATASFGPSRAHGDASVSLPPIG